MANGRQADRLGLAVFAERHVGIDGRVGILRTMGLIEDAEINQHAARNAHARELERRGEGTLRIGRQGDEA